jgi:hypothetical protein
VEVKNMRRHVRPIVCPPQCIVKDTYIQREIPVIHPVVTINRQHIVNVPRHIYQPITRNEVVDPGYPGKGWGCGCGCKR